jgi:hypothetical protein
MLKLPAPEYVCVVFGRLGNTMVWVFPSPKLHVHWVIYPDETCVRSVNEMLDSLHAGLEKLKFTRGAGEITIVWFTELLHPVVSETVSVTTYVPGLA